MDSDERQTLPISILDNVDGIYSLPIRISEDPEPPITTTRFCTCGCACKNCGCPVAGLSGEPWNPVQAASSGGSGNPVMLVPAHLNAAMASFGNSISTVPALSTGPGTYESDAYLSIDSDFDNDGARLPTQGDFNLYDSGEITDTSEEDTDPVRTGPTGPQSGAGRDLADNENPSPAFVSLSGHETEDDGNDVPHSELPTAASTILSRHADPEDAPFPMDLDDNLDDSVTSSTLVRVSSNSRKPSSDESTSSSFFSTVYHSLYSNNTTNHNFHLTGVGSAFQRDGTEFHVFRNKPGSTEQGPFLRLLG